ncbi:MAG: glycosyltransferase [Planctomycetota bacterium]
MDGNFTYEPAGLLDHDRQFFTLRRLERLLTLAGFESEIVHSCPGRSPVFQEVVDGSLAIGDLQLEGLDGQSSQEFFIYQFLVQPGESPLRRHALMCDQPETIDDLLKVEPNHGMAMVPDLGRLREPAKWLRNLHAQLRDGDKIRIAFKTCRHQRVLSRLLMGEWDQPLEGDTSRPLRFFTRREVEKLLFRTGYVVESFQPEPTSEWSQWQAAERPLVVSRDGLFLNARSLEDAEEFHVTGYNVTARPAAPRTERLTSIVIVTHNQWDYTRQCLESIRFRTDEKIEIIVVDNGSTDATVDCLRQRGDVTLIENSANLGFPKGANQGIAVARGDYILLLNNDVVVTTGWLRRLLDALEQDPGLGLVGPCSNNVSGEQCVPVEYDDLACLDGWAWQWSKQHAGARTLTDRLVGFCLMIRREVLQSIGTLDERFEIGCFEDDDLCRRAMDAGYKAAIVWDSFVHHFGSRTFLGSGVDFAGILERNRQKYLEKWEPAKPADSLVDSLESQDSLREPETIKRRPTLSLCMIARDNEGTIGPALESIRPWVDELIVVDTGSEDRTREIARALGARVFEFPWCDDFSAARNCSLAHAQGDWILWMDSDDVMDEENGRRLRELLDAPTDPSLWGYVLQVHCPSGDGELEATAVDHVKLFRNRKGIHFEGRIHEQVLPSIRRGGGEVAWTDLFLVHEHSDRTPEGRKRKLERDFRILKLDLQERPDHPFVLFNLGMTHVDAGQHEEAIEALVRCLEVSDVEQSHVRKAYSILASAHVERREFDLALTVCQRGRAHFPLDAELLFREAMLQHHFGRLEEAEALYRRVLDDEEERHFTSVDRGLAGHKARHNLARVLEDRGNLAAAESEWRNICQLFPEYLPGWQGLGDVLIRQGKLQEAMLEAASWRENPRSFAAFQREGHLLGSKAAVAISNDVEAERLLAVAVRRFPEDPEPLRAWCRYLFEHADPQFALPALSELARREPDDASTYHNLGAVTFDLATRATPLNPSSDPWFARIPPSPRCT